MEIYLENNNKPWFYKVKKIDEVFNNENGKFDLENFSKKFNFNIEDFKTLNGKVNKIAYGDILVIPPSSKYYHIVQPAENLNTISKKYGIPAEEIAKTNNINQIFIGQKLFL